MRRNYLIITALCAAIPLLRCSIGPLAGGYDVPDFKVLGTIVATNGQGAPDTKVQMIPVTFDPVNDPPLPDSLADTTDAHGRFRFSDVPQGEYNILAVHRTQRTRLLISGIAIDADSIVIPTDTLEAPGAVKVFLSSPDTLDTANGYFYFAGTTVSVPLKGSSGFVVLDSVPAGRTPALYYAVKGNPSAPHKVKDSLTVASAATTSIIYNEWNRSRRLFLNTTASGANVPGAATGFPVLIRLNRKYFNFTEAKSGGEDLRFTASGGTPLSFEIERWDTTAGEAEVWVRVDTVFGNNGTQYITLHWGNAAAAAASNGKAVFDTCATGGAFQGVWHMGQPGNSTAPDATANGYDGTPYNMTAASSGMGLIGRAQKFYDDRAYIEMKNTANGSLNFPENGRFTISAWVNADTIDLLHRVIASKGPQQYYLELINTLWEFGVWKSNKGPQITGAASKAWRWCHIVGVRNDTVQYFYLNGAPADSTVGEKLSNLPADQSHNFALGADPQFQAQGGNPGYASFYGKLDEVRVAGVARNGDWIKLCYENQKEPDALVVFE